MNHDKIIYYKIFSNTNEIPILFIRVGHNRTKFATTYFQLINVFA